MDNKPKLDFDDYLLYGFMVLMGLGAVVALVVAFSLLRPDKANAEVFLSAPSHIGGDEFAVTQIAPGLTLVQDRSTGREYLSDGHGLTLRRGQGCQ